MPFKAVLLQKHVSFCIVLATYSMLNHSCPLSLIDGLQISLLLLQDWISDTTFFGREGSAVDGLNGKIYHRTASVLHNRHKF